MLEEAGFDSVWITDHIVMPAAISSRYPFSDDGVATWPTERPWHDALTSMAIAVASTSRVEVGSAVLVLPLRNPIQSAKQVASLDVESAGRLVLGVGAGWLAEEFEAMGVDFSCRGQLLSEYLEVIRACWTGLPEPFQGKHFSLPHGLRCYPVPAHKVPVLIGGNTQAARRRAGREGDGWLGLERLERFDVQRVASLVRSVQMEADLAGRRADPLRLILRIINSQGHASRIAEWLGNLEASGVTEIVVDVRWEPSDALETLECLQTHRRRGPR